MIASNIATESRMRSRQKFRSAVRRLADIQKKTGPNAPAYSRFVNRRVGRYLAAAAFCVGLTPNVVTGISALFTFSGVVILVVFPPSAWLGIAVGTLLVLGYALDSADGQLARLRGGGSVAGEWLDHMVDALKVSTLPLALLVGLFRFGAAPVWWLIVPITAAIVGSALFFGMILTEQLRVQDENAVSFDGVKGRAPTWLRSLLVLPMDYGILCLSFFMLGALPVFLVVYSLITLLTSCFFLLAATKWFRELKSYQYRVE